jgi:hypothetical protein
MDGALATELLSELDKKVGEENKKNQFCKQN